MSLPQPLNVMRPYIAVMKPVIELRWAESHSLHHLISHAVKLQSHGVELCPDRSIHAREWEGTTTFGGLVIWCPAAESRAPLKRPFGMDCRRQNGQLKPAVSDKNHNFVGVHCRGGNEPK